MIRRSTWMMLGLFLVLLAAAFLWQRGRPTEAETTPTLGAINNTVLDFEADALIGLIIEEPAQGRLVALAKTDSGNWTLVEPSAPAADTSQVESILSKLKSLNSLASLNEPPALETIGLDQPAYAITLMKGDRQKIVVNIGKLTPTGSGYYASVDGGIPQVAEKTGIDTILKVLDQPPFPPTSTPTLESTPEELTVTTPIP